MGNEDKGILDKKQLSNAGGEFDVFLVGGAGSVDRLFHFFKGREGEERGGRFGEEEEVGREAHFPEVLVADV